MVNGYVFCSTATGLLGRMKDLDYDDWLLDRHEPINVQHAIRDHLLDTPWEPPSSASAPS